MKKIIIAALAAVTIGTASAATYKVDEYHANARFSIDHFNTSTNVGGFYGLTGSVEFDQAKRDGKIDINIPVANLQSGSQHFTDHLKSADIFDAAQYPDIRFVSTKFNRPRQTQSRKIQLLPKPDVENRSLRRRLQHHHQPHQMGHGLPR